MNHDRNFTFIKAIDENYFDSFIKEGQICMNTLKWFREYENIDSNIGDKFEGSLVSSRNNFKIKFADVGKENWTTLGKGENLRVTNSENDANLYCLFILKLDITNAQQGKFLVSKKFKEEYSYHKFVLILNPKEFITRIEKAISNLGKVSEKGFVKYYQLNDKVKSNLTNFHKPYQYSYQKEFRILFRDQKAKKRILNIGSLKEICCEINLTRKFKIELCHENQYMITQVD